MTADDHRAAGHRDGVRTTCARRTSPSTSHRERGSRYHSVNAMMTGEPTGRPALMSEHPRADPNATDPAEPGAEADHPRGDESFLDPDDADAPSGQAEGNLQPSTPPPPD
jgi:hypothetical protein